MAENTTPKKEVKETPGYVKGNTLADVLDLSKGRITQLTDEGVLKKYHLAVGVRYNLIESIRAYVRFLREKLNQKSDSPLNDKKTEIEIRLKTAKAERAEMELKEFQGSMYRWEDVKAVMNGYVFEVRSMLMGVPGRLARDLAPEQTPEEVSVRVRDEMNEILENLSRFQFDPEVYMRRIRERNGAADYEQDEDEE